MRTLEQTQTQTQNLIKEMLTENTGSHFLDSGGAYGRHWQENQFRDFDSEPEVLLRFLPNGEFDFYSVNIYHYLCEVLELDECAIAANKILEQEDDTHWVDEAWNCLRELFKDFHNDPNKAFLKDNFDLKRESEVKNTYNYEENLSQVLQFKEFTLDDGYQEIPYVMLQVHNGADVRGGYTDTRVFKLKGLLDSLCDVIGTIDGLEVDNLYDGINLTTESGERVEVTEESEVSLQINPMEDDEQGLVSILFGC